MKNNILFLMIIFFQFSLYSQWMKVEEIPNVDILSLYAEGENIYAGADSVIYISTNSGVSWKPSAKIADSVDAISALLKHNSIIFAGTYKYGIFISDDEGESWLSLNDGLTGLGSKYISDFEIRGDSIYASTIGSSVFVLNLNEMKNWKHFNNNIPVAISSNTEDVYNFNNNMIAAAGGNGYIYRNSFNESAWNEIKFGEMTGEPNAMLKFSSVDDIIVGGSTYGVYYSTNSGDTWEYIPSEVGFINEASIFKHQSRLYIFLSRMSSSHLYEFSSEAKALIPIESLNGVTVIDAVITGNKIFTGRISTGLWYKEFTPTSVDDKYFPKNYSISQNFPNPFNPTTAIKYSIPIDANVKIVVYDLLGKEIGKIVDDFKSAGEHEVNFNAGNIVSGIYFYKISVMKEGSLLFNESRKMILLK